MTIAVVAVISPAPGKEARCEELLVDMTKKVHANEPGALRYQLHKSLESTDLVVIESYKEKADFDAHKTTEGFQNLIKLMTEETLVSKPPVIVPCSSVAGFESR